ncbi:MULTISPECIES: dockerin type I domain-containing protein [unclassified Ruminococcus]|uniref:dockerin type I domain-containing protein n=1 Tax=unclassified Ruminococcus TaxID=2608920 RepID=UPI002109C74E|nr:MULTISPECIES: dockerin type I domain-containing protein [unclassified Ruminococcus]MCQ4021577.1 hypothetical protein [Ruminococcus sp. zg-924]MCQ4114022.1 hypothetical protein [Ruminococcus sp. zg-921]
MKKRIAAVLLAVTLVLSCFEARAYTYYDVSKLMNADDFRSCADSSGGIFLSAKYGSALEFMYINGSGASGFSFEPDGLTLEAFSGSNGIVGAVLSGTDVSENGVNISQLQILTYDFKKNFNDINTVSATIAGRDSFALGKNEYYILQDDLKTIRAYSLDSVFKFSVRSFRPVDQLLYDSAADCLYVVYSDGIGLLDGDVLYDLGNLQTPVTLCGKSAVISSSGRVYAINGRTIKSLCTVPSSSCAVIRNMVYYSDGSMIYSMSGSGEVLSYLDTGEYIYQLFPCGTKVGALNDSGELMTVAANEMEPVVKPTRPEASSDSKPPESISSELNGKGGITSDLYTIDNSAMTVTGIKPQTTIAVFKTNIDYSDYKAVFRNYDGKTRTSGNVGTGFTAEFTGADKKSYTLIVSGDLTGEGNVNSLDVRSYMRCLCGKAQLDFPFKAALDINGDSECDVLDLLVAAKQ